MGDSSVTAGVCHPAPYPQGPGSLWGPSTLVVLQLPPEPLPRHVASHLSTVHRDFSSRLPETLYGESTNNEAVSQDLPTTCDFKIDSSEWCLGKILHGYSLFSSFTAGRIFLLTEIEIKIKIKQSAPLALLVTNIFKLGRYVAPPQCWETLKFHEWGKLAEELKKFSRKHLIQKYI